MAGPYFLSGGAYADGPHYWGGGAYFDGHHCVGGGAYAGWLAMVALFLRGLDLGGFLVSSVVDAPPFVGAVVG